VIEGVILVFVDLYTVGGGGGEIGRRNCLKVPHLFEGGLGILLRVMTATELNRVRLRGHKEKGRVIVRIGL
jgi:hypothetical protein